MEKTCKKCGVVYPLTSEFWRVKTREKCGFTTPCKNCHRKHEKEKRFNPEKKKRNQIQYKKWYLKNRGYTTKRTRLENFGINENQYQELVKKQNGVCAICGNPEKAKINGNVKSLAVDHCHKTNLIRGLLCSNCNTALGLLKDNVQILQKMINYLNNL